MPSTRAWHIVGGRGGLVPGALLRVELLELLGGEVEESDSAIMRRTSSTVTLALALMVGDGDGTSSGGFEGRMRFPD